MSSNRNVGVRQLKNATSEVLRWVKQGETVTINERRQPVAIIVPLRKATNEHDALCALVQAGRITWSGGKPEGDEHAPKVRGASVSRAVIEDRR